MKIKISKSQWEETGKKAGWMKKEAVVTKQFPAKINVYGAGNAIPTPGAGQQGFQLEIEVQIGPLIYNAIIGQNIPEVQELYQAIGNLIKQEKMAPSAG